MKVDVEQVYTSVACNRTPEIIDWNQNGVICFGAKNAVVIYDTAVCCASMPRVRGTSQRRAVYWWTPAIAELWRVKNARKRAHCRYRRRHRTRDSVAEARLYAEYKEAKRALQIAIAEAKIFKGKDPLRVLTHHRSQVNSVKWLHKPDGTCTELISASADKTAAIWTLEDGGWQVTSTLVGHTDGVTCIHGLYNGDELVVFTGSIDSTIRVWERRDGITTNKQTICLSSGLSLTLHAHILPTTQKPALFCALDDHKIHIFVGTEYHRILTLTGHEDWVRGLDVLDVDDSTILLASASQDTYIRLWRIQKHTEVVPSRGIKVEQKVFPAYEQLWSVKLDAVLAGHEGWVYGVQWQPCFGDVKKPIYRLLSSSLDKTLIVWEPESSPQKGEGDGAWVEKVRVGEVGGNGLGFYGSRFGPDGASFLGHGYNGSLHIWSHCKETNQWQPVVVCGGHYSSVEDARWEPGRGRYLLSAAADQTTRLHAPWCTGNGPAWHELARPQVHGYDMASIAPVNSTTFVSAAEEKVIRVFTAPHNFVNNFKNIVGVPLVEGDSGGPEGASVPSLGLSNKAVFIGEDQHDSGDDNDGFFVPVDMTEPPTEETLMQNTLWPEVQKLYGHGYEVFALDASTDGELLASACKATTAEHAAVLIWETSNWQQIQKLVSHSLTVTQIAFSPDSQNLLSVSRDRRWTLYQREEGSNSFTRVACTDKTNGVHTRIIWCCAWAQDNSMFGTGSRDGKVCIWSKTPSTSDSSLGQYSLLGKPLEVPNASVTALAFAPYKGDEKIVATGFESGIVRIYSFDNCWSLLRELNTSMAHHLTVKRLTFRPTEDKRMLLASCGLDHFVRIYSVYVTL